MANCVERGEARGGLDDSMTLGAARSRGTSCAGAKDTAPS